MTVIRANQENYDELVRKTGMETNIREMAPDNLRASRVLHYTSLSPAKPRDETSSLPGVISSGICGRNVPHLQRVGTFTPAEKRDWGKGGPSSALRGSK